MFTSVAVTASKNPVQRSGMQTTQSPVLPQPVATAAKLTSSASFGSCHCMNVCDPMLFPVPNLMNPLFALAQNCRWLFHKQASQERSNGRSQLEDCLGTYSVTSR